MIQREETEIAPPPLWPLRYGGFFVFFATLCLCAPAYGHVHQGSRESGPLATLAPEWAAEIPSTDGFPRSEEGSAQAQEDEPPSADQAVDQAESETDAERSPADEESAEEKSADDESAESADAESAEEQSADESVEDDSDEEESEQDSNNEQAAEAEEKAEEDSQETAEQGDQQAETEDASDETEVAEADQDSGEEEGVPVEEDSEDGEEIVEEADTADADQDEAEETKEKHVIGATATVLEKQSELLFRARVDTGAKSCSLHVERVIIEDESEGWRDNIGKVIHFEVKNGSNQTHMLQGKIHGYVIIKTSQGRERRYKVPLTFRWRGVEKRVLVTLSDRDHMEFPLLLGRNFLRNDFVVDVTLDSDD